MKGGDHPTPDGGDTAKASPRFGGAGGAGAGAAGGDSVGAGGAQTQQPNGSGTMTAEGAPQYAHNGHVETVVPHANLLQPGTGGGGFGAGGG